MQLLNSKKCLFINQCNGVIQSGTVDLSNNVLEWYLNIKKLEMRPSHLETTLSLDVGLKRGLKEVGLSELLCAMSCTTVVHNNTHTDMNSS